MKPPSFTLTAGPGLMSDRVRAALAAQTVAHTDPSFHERFLDLERKFAQLLATEHDIVLLQAEAIVGLEAGARPDRPRHEVAQPRLGALRRVVRRLAARLRRRGRHPQGALRRVDRSGRRRAHPR